MKPHVGDLRVVRVTFDTLATPSVPVDPTTVTVRSQLPDGTSVDTVATRDGPGRFHADITFSQAGDWRLQGIGEGIVPESTPIMRVDVLALLPAPTP